MSDSRKKNACRKASVLFKLFFCLDDFDGFDHFDLYHREYQGKNRQCEYKNAVENGNGRMELKEVQIKDNVRGSKLLQ